ncbi:hypothetical protein COP2_003122 [Malus domestica]
MENNVIFGRTYINDLMAMVSTYMLLMKFPTLYGNGYIKGDQLSGRSCYNTSVKQQHLPMPKETFSIHDQVIKTNPDKANLDLHGDNSQPDDPRDDSFTQVPNKASPQKPHQQKLHQWMTTTNSQKLHTILIKIV